MNITPFVYSIKDKNLLLAAYMPYIKNGGLFLKGIQLPMGHSVGFILDLPGENTRYGVDGKVVWVTVLGLNQGVGVQFSEGAGTQQMKLKMDQVLMGMDRTKLPTFTC